MNMTIIRCVVCNKVLKAGEKEFAEKNNIPECAECLFHRANDTFTIEKYNAWLKGGKL